MTFDPFSQSRPARVGFEYVTPGRVPMGLDGNHAISDLVGSLEANGRPAGKGTVIPHHKPGRGGGSLGYNPHKPPNKHVTIDPHIPGMSVQLDLGKIDEDSGKEAYQAGAEFAEQFMADPPPSVDGIETTIQEGPRMAAYAASRILADRYGARPDHPAIPRMSQVVQAVPGAAASPIGEPTTQGHRHAGLRVPAPGTPPSVNVVSGGGSPGAGPLARFRPAAPAPAAAPTFAPSAAPAVAPAAGVGPPTRRVVFDFGASFGQHVAEYHEVHRTQGGLVLGWDTRWPHGQPYSPEGLKAQFAAQVEGDPEALLIEPVGATFTFTSVAGMRFFHLGVVDSLREGA